MTRTRIDVPSSTRAPSGRTAAYVLGTADGLVVDPSAPTDRLLETCRRQTVSHLAVTHHHPDHVAGVRTVADELDCTVWARRGREKDFIEMTGITPDRTFGDGTTIPAGRGIDVIDTPGHASEHVAFVTDGGIVSGDLAVAEGSVVVGPPDGDMRSYLTSLRRVYARDPPALFPAHGPTIEEPRSTCERLLRHRLDREHRIRIAVQDGARTPDEIVAAAYEKDVSDVYDLARATVVAHLEKLAVEGTVQWDGQRARPN